MEEVVCSCLKCQAELGRFKNYWNGIGSTYYSPVYPPVTYINGFETIGGVNQAASGSLVENSFLQDLACRKCQTVIGMRCDSAPDGHMLRENQLLLRLILMSVTSFQTGQKAVISVQEKFALTLPGAKRLSTPRRASTVQPSRSETPGMLSGRKSTNGSMLPPPTPDKSQRDLDSFKVWTENAIAKQKKDIDRIGGVVDRVERGMKSFESFMKEIRAEIVTSREAIPSQEDLASIREDLNGFRDELASYLQIQHPKQQDLMVIRDKLNGLRRDIDMRNEPDVSRHDFEVLIKDVQKVDRKASGIEVLAADLENLKSQFLFLQDLTRNASFSKDNEVNISSLADPPNELNMAESAFVDLRSLELRRDDGEYLQSRPGPNIYREKSTVISGVGVSQSAKTVSGDIQEVEERTKSTVKEPVALPKRKRNRVEDSTQVLDSEAPVKRARRSIKRSSAVGPQPSKQQQPIVISPDHGSTAIPGSDDILEDELNKSEEAPGLEVGPRIPLQNPTISELRGRKVRPRTVSLNLLPDIIPQNLKRPGRPRAVSQSNTPITSQAAPLTSALQARPAENIASGRPDPIAVKQRDASGARPISTETLIPSIEKDGFAIVIPSLRMPGPATVTIDTDKPLRCNVCRKRYKHAWRLERHLQLPACARPDADGLAEEAKKKKMAQREALVKLMLEREM